MIKTILVTGANGFIGSHLLPRLVGKGYVVENKFTSQMQHYMRYDCIIHLAAVTNISLDFDPKLIESNILLTQEVFNLNSKRVIFASSCSARHSTNPYAWTKIYGEHLAIQHENSIALRFFNVYGPNNNKGIIKFLFDQPDGSQVLLRGPHLIRDYIYVDDVVTEIMQQVEGIEKGLKDVGTGIGHTTKAVVEIFMEETGRKFKIEEIDPYPHEPPVMVAKTKPWDWEKFSLREGIKMML